MLPIELYFDTNKALRFTGDMIANVSTVPKGYAGDRGLLESDDANRWQRLSLYRCLSGKLICFSSDHAIWECELPTYTYSVCQNEAQVRAFFGDGALSQALYQEASIAMAAYPVSLPGNAPVEPGSEVQDVTLELGDAFTTVCNVPKGLAAQPDDLESEDPYAWQRYSITLHTLDKFICMISHHSILDLDSVSTTIAICENDTQVRAFFGDNTLAKALYQQASPDLLIMPASPPKPLYIDINAALDKIASMHKKLSTNKE